jgi:hypothetical protein
MTSMTEVMNGKRVCPRRLRDKVLFFFDKTAPQSISCICPKAIVFHRRSVSAQQLPLQPSSQA